jgi:hypothetical protein
MRTSLVIVIAALVALLSSVATVGAERLITGADIKDGSITGRDIRSGSIDIERIERAGRNNVYRSKARTPRVAKVPTVGIATNSSANVAMVTVPAGEYVIQGSLTPFLTQANMSVTCSITDSAGILTTTNNGGQWMNQVTNQIVTIPVFATATYSGSTAVYLNCSAFGGGVGTAYWPTLIAEQVSLVN